ncbi:MAG: hypothetical protein QM705_08305 [Ancrocorticia sp.]
MLSRQSNFGASLRGWVARSRSFFDDDVFDDDVFDDDVFDDDVFDDDALSRPLLSPPVRQFSFGNELPGSKVGDA